MAKDIIYIELENNEKLLETFTNQSKQINQELEQIRLILDELIDLTLSMQKNINIKELILTIKEKLSFIEDISVYLDKINVKKANVLWDILSIVRDVYAEKEDEKDKIEAEIQRVKKEITEMLDMLKENGKRR